MKRSFLLFVAMIIGIMLSAQTQQGYVKTKGRLVNGQIVHGQGLNGATVSIKGRTAVLVKSNDGSFSFPVPEAQFRIDSVRKKGYQLIDMDILSKTHKCSANPIYLVMETPEQMIEDQMDNFERINAAQQRLISTLRAELKQLKAKNKVTEEEYSWRLQEIVEMQTGSQQLVNEMVERYSKIDYDQLSEFDQLISKYILNGELVKADSMLRTKGDIIERVEQYKKDEMAIAKEKKELSQRQEQLEQSEALSVMRLDDLANDCYRKFEIFKMQHLNDSAAYYLKLRSGLDTTNTDWINETGDFIQKYLADYNKSIEYFISALRQNLLQYGELDLSVATSYYYLGTTYALQGEYNKAQEHFIKALNIYGENHPDAANCYNNLGYIYTLQGDFPKALKYYNKALSIQKSIYGESHPYVANSYNNIGGVYSNQGNYAKGLEYYNTALNIKKRIFGEDHIKLAACYNNIGSIYSYQGEYDKALEYNNKALTIKLNVFGNNHPDVAKSYNNIGLVESRLGDNSKAIENYSKALNIWKSVLGENHEDVAACYNNLGAAYSKQRDYENATLYYQKALAILKNLFGENDIKVATLYNNIGRLYGKQNEYDKALEYYNKAIEILKPILGEAHPNIATIYHNIGSLSYERNNITEALNYYNKAYSILNTLYGSEDSKTKEAKDEVERIQAKLKEQENEKKQNQ